MQISQKKDCIRTQRSFYKVKKNVPFFFHYIFIYIYLYIYCILKKEQNILAFFCKRTKHSRVLLRSLQKNVERMSASLKKCWLKNLKSCFSMFYTIIWFKKKLLKKLANGSFPLFWWAMWVNHSFRSNQMSNVNELLR